MKTISLIFSTLVLIFCSVTTIQAGEAMKYQNLSDVPAAKWQELFKKKIYFGHQSVGYNIIDGIKANMKEHPEIHLNIVESRKAEGADGAFIHSRVGENTRPETKIADFVNIIDQELGITPDMAALKFCYVDANDKVDVRVVFAEYKQAMDKLKKEHPALTIIHFTMPLRTQPVSWKTKVKLLMGKEPWEFKDNIKRNQFNQFLLHEYQGKVPVFDIAGVEATLQGSGHQKFSVQGATYLSLNPHYTSDGGHLNKQGQLVVARAFLLFLANNI